MKNARKKKNIWLFCIVASEINNNFWGFTKRKTQYLGSLKEIVVLNPILKFREYHPWGALGIRYEICGLF